MAENDFTFPVEKIWIPCNSPLQTAAGVPYKEIAQRLAVPFDNPEKAYIEIEGGRAGKAGLIDIKTGFMIERLNEVFGLRGVGWDLEYSPEDLVMLGDITSYDPVGYLKKAFFVFPLFTENWEHFTTIRILTDGISKNSPEYCLEGARTKAIGQAIKWLCFQLPVYQNLIVPLPKKTGTTKTSPKNVPNKSANPTTPKEAPTKATKKETETPTKPNPETGSEPIPFDPTKYKRATEYKVPAGLPNEDQFLGTLTEKPNGSLVLQYLAGKIQSPQNKVFYKDTSDYDDKLAHAAEYVLTYQAQATNAPKEKSK